MIKQKSFPYLMLLPFITVSVVFTLIPTLYSLYISFYDFSFLDPQSSIFVGVSNYRTVLSDGMFITSLVNTGKYLLFIVPMLIILPVLLASLLNGRMKYRSYFRSAFYLPYVVSPVAMGVIAVQLFSKENFIVVFLSKLGLSAVSWHTASPYAFLLVVIVTIWSQMGFYTVLYLSGLQNIQKELYEASSIDGTNAWQQFFYITVPQLNKTTVLVVFMSMLSTIQLFDQPYVISTVGQSSPGSPGGTTMSMIMYIYTKAFRYWEMGPASAAAFIVFMIILVVSVCQNMLRRER